MNSNNQDGVAPAHQLNEAKGLPFENRIALFIPESVYEALKVLESALPEYPRIKTTLNRTVVPAYGGPETLPRKHVSAEAIEYLKSITLQQLETAVMRQDHYLQSCDMTPANRRRHRCYLLKFLAALQQQGWLRMPISEDQPRFNQLIRPAGQRRVYASDLRTTDRKQPQKYRLGTSDTHYVCIDGRQVLGNSLLEQQLKDLETYISSVRENAPFQMLFVKQVFGFIHDVRGIQLADLSLDSLIPFVQLKFSEQDFQGHSAFETNPSGQLLDPLAAEQTLAMAEALGRRRAEQKADYTIHLAEEYFEWRDKELIALGEKTGGLANSSKQKILDVLILVAEFRFKGQTHCQRPRVRVKRRGSGFHDIPVIVHLTQKYSDYPLDKAATKYKIQKTRCISWPEAIVVCEKQRRRALIYFIDSRDSSRKQKFVRRLRALSGIATDMQQALALAFSVFIPTDRQQTYRGLRFGHTLRYGYFDSDRETFIDQNISNNPNEAEFWLDLSEYKTASKYGRFWYPIPNITFVDGTTFYELIFAWLWGFEDTERNWPICYEQNPLWQGYIDAEGNRMGWREALAPNGHDFFLTRPKAKDPFDAKSFCTMIQGIFTRFTQETGRPVKVSPHSMRHMLSSYLDRLELSEDEKRSFSYVLHHSPETHEESYVYRDRLRRVAPAAERMKAILQDMTFPL